MKKPKLPVCAKPCVNSKKMKMVFKLMPPAGTILDLAAFFDAFSDPTRARILIALRGARLCVCDIAGVVNISVSAVSHQLRLLRALRLVRYTCKGRMVFYELDDRHVRKILDVGLSHISERTKTS